MHHVNIRKISCRSKIAGAPCLGEHVCKHAASDARTGLHEARTHRLRRSSISGTNRPPQLPLAVVDAVW
uniref:Uncharacterized protein n=1 Tax=Oryza brachyantha TaxID=4533 RepID=J3N4P8_ORYBR